MKLRAPIGLAMAAIVLIVTLSACGGSSGDSSTSASGGSGGPLAGKNVAFANFTEAAPLFVVIRESVEQAAQKLGADLKTYDNEAQPQKTQSNAQLITQGGTEGVMEFSPDPSLANALEASFDRSDVACIAVNVPLGENCSWFNMNYEELSGDTGRYVGMEAQKRGWSGADTTVLLVQSAAAGEAVNSSLGFFYVGLQKQFPGLTRLKSYKDLTRETTSVGDSLVQVDGQALREPSFKAVSGALQNLPAGRHLIIYTVSDDSALGAWRAVEQAGRDEDTMIAGFGGEAQALEELRTNPNWVAEGSVFVEHWGQYMMAMLQAQSEGQELPLMTSAPTAVLTKDESVPSSSIVPIATYYKKGMTSAFELPPLQPVRTGVTSGLGSGTLGNEYLAKTGVLQQFGNVDGLG